MAPTDLQKIYYLGGFPEGTILGSKQSSFHVPPVGGYLEVPEFNAKDLLQRNTRYFTRDARIAEMAARGEDIERFFDVKAALAPLSREDLLRMLAEMDAEESLESAEDTKKEEPASQRRPRNKKDNE